MLMLVAFGSCCLDAGQILCKPAAWGNREGRVVPNLLGALQLF